MVLHAALSSHLIQKPFSSFSLFLSKRQTYSCYTMDPAHFISNPPCLTSFSPPSTSPATQPCFPTFKPVVAHSSAGLDTGWKAIFLLHITELTLHQPADSSLRDTFPEKSAPNHPLELSYFFIISSKSTIFFSFLPPLFFLLFIL